MHGDVARSFSALVGNGFLSKRRIGVNFRFYHPFSPLRNAFLLTPLKKKRKNLSSAIFVTKKRERERERERKGEEILNASSRVYRSTRCTISMHANTSLKTSLEKSSISSPIDSRLVGLHSFILSASRISDNARLACSTLKEFSQLVACTR